MKRLALAISVLAVTATGALANPVYNWTGFYLGANVGYSWGRSASTLWFTDAGTTVSSANTRNDMNGVIGGGQLGYNWQFDNKWVFVLEADFQGSDQKGVRAALAQAAR